MPNWCEGVLKVRGQKENIKKFMLEVLKPIQNELGMIIAETRGLPMPESIKVEIVYDDDDEFTIKSSSGFYIEGTRRNFTESNRLEFYHNNKDEAILVIDNFKAAWGIDSEPYAAISKEYDIDVKIYGFERGMEFNQEIEIIKGEVITDREISFTDYTWDCIFPNIGG